MTIATTLRNPWVVAVSTVAAVVLGTVLDARTVSAAENPANDCLVGVLNEAGQQLSGTVSCTDGDPTCDTDSTVNGTCNFKVQGCLNIPGVAGCELRALKKFKFKTQKAKDLIQVTPINPTEPTSVCGAFVSFEVGLKKNGQKPGKRKIISSAKADVKPFGQNKDKDKTTFVCNPCLDPATCTGTPQPQCPERTDGPSQLTLTVGNTGTDLDTGFSGRSHNFITPSGSKLSYCLSGCDFTTNPVCQGSGSTGDVDTTVNGPTFGPPLPLFSANVAVCVINNYKDPTIQATFNLQDGSFDATATPVRLIADTYQGSPSQVCPRCVGGKCDSGRNEGQNCTVGGNVVVNNPPNIVNAQYPVSGDCLPKQADLLGSPNVDLPLTTATSTLDGNANGNGFPCPGQAPNQDECGGSTCTQLCGDVPDAKGGINQYCCTNSQKTPCFPTDPNTGIVKIERTGVPATFSPTPWGDTNYPKTGNGTVAATFCIPATGSITVDGTAGLAGPGALLLPGVEDLQ